MASSFRSCPTFDFSIYLDAEEELIHQWYIARFMRLRETAFRDPESFFHRYSQLSESAARYRRGALAEHQSEKSSREYFADQAPRRPHPPQGADHLIEEVALRKL
jgi:type I pantothenate kinase